MTNKLYLTHYSKIKNIMCNDEESVCVCACAHTHTYEVIKNNPSTIIHK